MLVLSGAAEGVGTAVAEGGTVDVLAAAVVATAVDVAAPVDPAVLVADGAVAVPVVEVSVAVSV